MKLAGLKVKSFTTELEVGSMKTVKGGATRDMCSGTYTTCVQYYTMETCIYRPVEITKADTCSLDKI